MNKWFSFNQRTQRTEVVTPSEELFQTSPLLFWTRGMSEWETGPKALEHFLTPPEPVAVPAPVIPVVEEKKQRMGPFYKNEITQPTVVASVPVPVFVPDEIAKKDPVKPLPKKRKKVKAVKKPVAKRKKISKHIILATKKQLKKSKKKAVLPKKKNRTKKRN